MTLCFPPLNEYVNERKWLEEKKEQVQVSLCPKGKKVKHLISFGMPFVTFLCIKPMGFLLHRGLSDADEVSLVPFQIENDMYSSEKR
jgi:hypothetical protein